MKTINVNTGELENVSRKFPALNQEKKVINVPFEVYGFAELYFMKLAIYETIEFISANGYDNESTANISNIKLLVSIAKQLDIYNLHEFADELLLPLSHIETQPIKQK